jgi:hypothetical protein
MARFKKRYFKERIKNIIQNNVSCPITYNNNYAYVVYNDVCMTVVSYVPRYLANISKINILRSILIYLGINSKWVLFLLLAII